MGAGLHAASVHVRVSVCSCRVESEVCYGHLREQNWTDFSVFFKTMANFTWAREEATSAFSSAGRPPGLRALVAAASGFAVGVVATEQSVEMK